MTPHRVEFEQTENSLLAGAGETILDIALRNGVEMEYDCRNGVCGACRCTLISGEVELRPYLDIALEEEERAQGVILGCRAVPKSDVRIALPDPEEPLDLPWTDTTAVVAEARVVTSDIIVLRLAPETPVRFVAGQYAEFTFGDLSPRSYSFANAPGDETLELHVRAVPGGAVSPHIFSNVGAGVTARVRGPKGMAYLRELNPLPLVLCAGGTGLAPVMSMLRHLARQKRRELVHFYFGVRSEADIYLEDELNELLSRLGSPPAQIVLSEVGAKGRRHGYLSDAVQQDLGDLSGHRAYLCGPPVMIDTCRRVLLQKGLPPKACYTDVFWTAPASPA